MNARDKLDALLNDIDVNTAAMKIKQLVDLRVAVAQGLGSPLYDAIKSVRGSGGVDKVNWAIDNEIEHLKNQLGYSLDRRSS